MINETLKNYSKEQLIELIEATAKTGLPWTVYGFNP